MAERFTTMQRTPGTSSTGTSASRSGVGGPVLGSVFSREIDDEVHSTLYFPRGKTSRISVNWSDESCRKMTIRITAWGTAGRIFADRQEIQVCLRNTAIVPDGYERGWNVRYTTELTELVGFYLRGEECSAQIEHFVARIRDRTIGGINAFESAAETHRVVEMMIADAQRGASTLGQGRDTAPVTAERRRRFRLPRLVPQPAPQSVGQFETRGGA